MKIDFDKSMNHPTISNLRFLDFKSQGHPEPNHDTTRENLLRVYHFPFNFSLSLSFK